MRRGQSIRRARLQPWRFRCGWYGWSREAERSWTGLLLSPTGNLSQRWRRRKRESQLRPEERLTRPGCRFHRRPVDPSLSRLSIPDSILSPAAGARPDIRLTVHPRCVQRRRNCPPAPNLGSEHLCGVGKSPGCQVEGSVPSTSSIRNMTTSTGFSVEITNLASHSPEEENMD